MPASVPARAAALRATTRKGIDIDPKTLLEEKKHLEHGRLGKGLTRWKIRRRNTDEWTDQVDLAT